MKNCIILCCFFSLLSASVFAQVGIGTTNPQASLDISSSTGGGVLVPKYALTGSNDVTTVVNPDILATGLEIGTLIYNTTPMTPATAPENAVDEGFKYWDGARWQGLGPKTGVMLRRFASATSGVGASGSVFNYPSLSFSNIVGATYTSNKIVLPRGTYIIESQLRLNSNNSVDWLIRLDGTEIPGSVRGSTNPPNNNTVASEVQLVAAFEIVGNSGEIDFQMIFGTGATVLPGQCYVKIEKIN